MKIKRIRTQNYRGKNFDLEPAKINLFFAKNGTGKTSLCDAVRYGITGLVRRIICTAGRYRSSSITECPSSAHGEKLPCAG